MADETAPAPLAEKRFALNNEKTARPRLEKFRETFKQLDPQLPELVGATLSGSMVKGAAKTESDIDAYIFIDPDKIKEGLDAEGLQEANNSDSRKVADLIATKKYKTKFTEPLMAMGMTAEQLRGMQIKVLTKDIIANEVKTAVISTETLITYNQAAEAHIESGDYLEWSANNPLPEHYFVDGRISELFHLAMGKGIQEYRQQVIDLLKAQGAVGESVWKEIISDTSFMEKKHMENNYQDLFPQTLDEAIAYYHLPTSQISTI